MIRSREAWFRAAFGARTSSQAGASVALAVVALAGVALTAGCRPKDELIVSEWSDAFERAELGPDWRDTGGGYRIDHGRLAAQGAHNHPVWLRKRLPADVVVEVDAVASTAAGDIKLELFGDGASFDPDRGAYTSTGYVLIFGGWHNSLSVICKGNEHGEGRKASRADRKVVPDRTYHWSILRKDGLLSWKVDGEPFLSWQDPSPLGGTDHAYLAVNDWETRVSFDNFVVEPVGP